MYYVKRMRTKSIIKQTKFLHRKQVNYSSVFIALTGKSIKKK